MDLEQLKDKTTNISVSFKKLTLIKINKFMKKNKLKKFSPLIDKMINEWFEVQKK